MANVVCGPPCNFEIIYIHPLVTIFVRFCYLNFYFLGLSFLRVARNVYTKFEKCKPSV